MEYSILSVDSHTRCINSENSFLLYHATVIDLHGRIARGNKSSVSYTGKWEDRQLPWWQRLRQIMTFAHGNYSGLWVAADYAYISFYCSSHKLFDRVVVEELVIVPNCCMWQQICAGEIVYDTNPSSNPICMLDKYRIHDGITSLETCLADKWSRKGRVCA